MCVCDYICITYYTYSVHSIHIVYNCVYLYLQYIYIYIDSKTPKTCGKCRPTLSK